MYPSNIGLEALFSLSVRGQYARTRCGCAAPYPVIDVLCFWGGLKRKKKKKNFYNNWGSPRATRLYGSFENRIGKWDCPQPVGTGGEVEWMWGLVAVLCGGRPVCFTEPVRLL